jgi:hypothetical protein
MTMNRTVKSGLFLLITAIIAFSGCRKDELNTDPKFRLGFSTDTVMFDTVFTTIGSSIQSLVIRNTGNSRINISKITLARGKTSPFRLNIDGTPTEEFRDLEIGPNDSAYIFVKVTIDPNNADSPLIESDSIVFETNGNFQDVKLVAWGQDAYFHTDAILSGDVTLPADKPHVVYGKLTAGNGCRLNILAGTKLYFHNGSSLEVRTGASIVVAGTLENPVTFTGDRLEDYYLDKPGLWDGIWLEKDCKNVSFTYAEITNAKVGIEADTFGFTNGDTLNIHNCLIHNMTNYGIRAIRSRICATNCQITNCGGNVVSIEEGGSYDFRNCTLARYFSGRGYPALSINNFGLGEQSIKSPFPLVNAYFGNCIITGDQGNELDLNELEGTTFNFQFDNCLVQWDKSYYSKYEAHFSNCISNDYARFIDSTKNNFQLDTLSVAIDAASITIINNTVPDITHDRKGVSRLIPGPPDLGAYERVEKR